MTDILDILSFARANKGQLNNVEVYGAIMGYLDRPESLNSSVVIDSNCVCVKVDIFAVKLDAYAGVLKANGIENPLNMYFVNGSMACYVDKRYKMPDWYTFRGNLAIGSKQFSPFLTMFNFSKDSTNKWIISGTPLSDVNFGEWGTDNRFVQYLSVSDRSGRIIVPDEVKQFLCCKAEMPKPEILLTGNFRSLNESLSQSMNGVQPKTVVSNKRFFVQDRDSLREFSKSYDKLEVLVKDADDLRLAYIKDLVDRYPLDITVQPKNIDAYKYMLTNLRRYYKNKPIQQANTGRAIVKSYLEKYKEYEEEYLSSTAGDYVLKIFDEVVDYLLDERDSVNASDKAWDLIKVAFLDSQLTYAGLLAVIVGLEVESLQAVAKACVNVRISFIDLVNKNPYELLMFSSGLTVANIEKLAHALGIQMTQDIKRVRNIGLLYNYTNHSESGSTCYKVSDLFRSNIGTAVTNSQHDMIVKTGSYLNDTIKSNIAYYVNKSVTASSRSYPVTGWKKDGMDWVLGLSDMELRSAINDFKQSGLGVQFKARGIDWITSMRLLEKELFVYNKIYELAQTKFNYDHDIIDKLINKFESIEGYKLEEKQRKAVHLCEFGVAVLTGPAGSGKTTTARCIVFVLLCYEEYKRIKHYNEMWEDGSKTDDEIIESLDVPDEDEVLSILYACPTGKAAKRLQEVVGSNVRTMHSLFGVGSLEEDIFSEDETDSVDSPDVYIFDENAMVTIDLLYSVLNKVSNPRIWFLGDISQLPPIGKGLPFKNLLRFAPCVRLTVSKRSAEGSGITYNSQVVNEFSESGNWKDLISTNDFKIIPCEDEEIPVVISLICKYYLGTLSPEEEPMLLSKLGIRSLTEMIKIPNLTEDDIQVVSPVGKATYSWGTTNINNKLQPIFNPKKRDSICFTYKPAPTSYGVSFRVGDRVIHNKNNYRLRWYSSWTDGILQETWDTGITNGDVGKIVAVLPSVECEFLEPNGKKPDDWKDNVRKDANYVADDMNFVVVEYYDFNSKQNYYILYHAKEVGGYSGSKNNKVFEGTDLSMIQLFYAGTCHKMQGSQNKLILTVLGNMKYSGFITRNMLYTMITRASEGEYLIGSVSNSRSSQLSVSRAKVADDNVDTIGELLYEV